MENENLGGSVPKQDEIVVQPEIVTMDSSVSPVVNEPIVDNTLNNDGSYIKPKKKMSKLFLIIGIVLTVLIAGGGITYYALTSNSKQLYKTVLDVKTGDLVEFLEDINKYMIEVDMNEDTFIFEGDMSVDSNLDQLSDYENYTYDYKLGLNLSDFDAYMELGVKDSSDIARVKLDYTDESFLVESSEIFNEVFEVMFSDLGLDVDMSVIENMNFESITFDESIYIIEKTTEFFGDSLDEDEFEKKDGSIRVNGEKIDVTKHVYTIDNKTMQNMTVSILKAMLDDDKYLEIIEKAFASTYEVYASQNNMDSEFDINEVIESLIDSVENTDAVGEEEIEIILHTHGIFNTVVGISVEINNEELLLYTEKDEQVGFFILEEQLEIFGDVEKNKLNLEVKSSLAEFDKFDVELKYGDGEYGIKIDYALDSTEAVLDSTVKLSKDNDDKMSVTLTMSASLNDSYDDIELNINTNTSLSVVDKLPELSDGVNINNLSEDDINTITSNVLELMETEPIKSFIEDFADIASSNGFEFDDESLNGSDNDSFGDLNDDIVPQDTSYSNIKEITYDDIFLTSYYPDEMILLISSTGCKFCDEIKPELNEAMIELGKEAWVIEVDKLDSYDADWLEFDFPYSGTPTMYHVVNKDTSKSMSGSTDKQTIIDWINK